MDMQSHSKSKIAAGIMATVAAVLLWGFGVEYALQNYVFVSPAESSFQKIK